MVAAGGRRSGGVIMAALRVLLVDDHAVVRAGYRRFLEADGRIEVVAEAADADSALRCLCIPGRVTVEVAVIDLSMPGRGGLDLLRHLRQRGDGPRVLVFSMHESLSMVRQALALGAVGYITKSSDPALLVDAVIRVAGGERVVSPELGFDWDALAHEAPHHQLSAREFEVFVRLARDEPLDAIADALCLSAKTVANLQTTIRTKLRIDSAIALHRYAREHGLID